jgi:hypothetical protein
MKSHYNLSRIEFAKRYLEKNTESNSTMQEVMGELCDEAQKLWEENALLREKLFEIEQTVEPEKQWENVLAAKLSRAKEENSKEDYLEITNSINNDIWIITIQKKFGNTPKQALQQSEVRRVKALNKVAHLLKENKRMQKKLSEQELELRVFKSLKLHFHNAESELKTRQEIEQAIDALNLYIGQYNNHIYRVGVANLSNSMIESYHESWSRAADSHVKVQELMKSNKELLLQITAKKLSFNKFGKYRCKKRRP